MKKIINYEKLKKFCEQLKKFSLEIEKTIDEKLKQVSIKFIVYKSISKSNHDEIKKYKCILSIDFSNPKINSYKQRKFRSLKNYKKHDLLFQFKLQFGMDDDYNFSLHTDLVCYRYLIGKNFDGLSDDLDYQFLSYSLDEIDNYFSSSQKLIQRYLHNVKINKFYYKTMPKDFDL